MKQDLTQDRIAVILKGCTLLAGLLCSLFCFAYLPLALSPVLAIFAYPATLTLPILLFLPCFVALCRFWEVCENIGNHNSFCRENQRAMGDISRCAAVLGVEVLLMTLCLHAGLLGLLRLVLLVCLCWGGSVLSWCLSRLIGNAAELKEQADLTI